MPDRVALTVYVNLDPTPGDFHSIESAQNIIRQILIDRIPHYCPMVSSKANAKQYKDWALLVQNDDIRAGGSLFMNDRAVVGEYFIRSDDPQKHDLSLPAHLFRRCFRFVVREYNGKFSEVEETV